jgi:hypothetical protein
MPKSVLLVDDNAAIRQALRQLFTSEADFDVCGEAGDERHRGRSYSEKLDAYGAADYIQAEEGKAEKRGALMWEDERAPKQFGNANFAGGSRTARRGGAFAHASIFDIIASSKRMIARRESAGCLSKTRGSSPKIARQIAS